MRELAGQFLGGVSGEIVNEGYRHPTRMITTAVILPRKPIMGSASEMIDYSYDAIDSTHVEHIANAQFRFHSFVSLLPPHCPDLGPAPANDRQGVGLSFSVPTRSVPATRRW